MNSNIGLLCGGFGILVFFGVGVAALIFGIRNREKGEASNSWPSVGGIITDARIEENTDVDEDGFSSTTYTPKWLYEYTLDGKTNTSERISFGAVRGYGRRKRAQEELDKFPVNSQVRVYYDPQNPGETVLVPGTKGTMMGIIIGIIFILLSIFGCIGGLIFVLVNA
jgi:hypothetical protein